MTNYMIFLCSDRSQHLSGTGPNQTGPNSLSGTGPNPSTGPVPTPQYPNTIAGLDPTGPIPTPQLDRSQPINGTGPNPTI